MTPASRNLLAGGAIAGTGAIVGGLAGGVLGAGIASDTDDPEHENLIIAWSAIVGGLLGAGIAGGIASWQLAKATAAAALAAQNPAPAAGQ